MNGAESEAATEIACPSHNRPDALHHVPQAAEHAARALL